MMKGMRAAPGDVETWPYLLPTYSPMLQFHTHLYYSSTPPSFCKACLDCIPNWAFPTQNPPHKPWNLTQLVKLQTSISPLSNTLLNLFNALVCAFPSLSFFTNSSFISLIEFLNCLTKMLPLLILPLDFRWHKNRPPIIPKWLARQRRRHSVPQVHCMHGRTNLFGLGLW